jgi:hypothetical protein
MQQVSMAFETTKGGGVMALWETSQRRAGITPHTYIQFKIGTNLSWLESNPNLTDHIYTQAGWGTHRVQQGPHIPEF